MPFKSKAQRSYLWANEPEVAEEFEKHTPKGAKLPEKVKKKQTHNAQGSSTMTYRTGSKKVACNVWSDAAREAAIEARREKGTKIGTVSVPPSEEEEGQRMDGAIQLRNQGALARHVGKALVDNPHPEGSYQHVQWRIGYQKGHLS